MAGACRRVLALAFALLPCMSRAQAPATPAARRAPVEAPAALPLITDVKPTTDNPYGLLRPLWKTSDAVAKIVLVLLGIMSVGSWYIMIVKLLEQSKMGRQASGRPAVLVRRPSARRRRARKEQRLPVHRRSRQPLRPRRAEKPYRLNEWIPMSITSAVDRSRAAGRAGVPGHRRFDLAFRRPVRHRLGHLPRADGHRHFRPGFHRQGGRPGGRGPDHDGHRPGGRDSRRAGYNWLARRNKAVMDEVREFSEELNAVILGSAGKAA